MQNAHDLILMAVIKESLHEKTVQWKSGLEAKYWKMKVMFGCSMEDSVIAKSKGSGPAIYVRRGTWQ